MQAGQAVIRKDVIEGGPCGLHLGPLVVDAGVADGGHRCLPAVR
jgi:hypothetical protein